MQMNKLTSELILEDLVSKLYLLKPKESVE